MSNNSEYRKYYSIESYESNPPGLYVKNYGPKELIGAEYKLINYLSLKEYDKKYADLGE